MKQELKRGLLILATLVFAAVLLSLTAFAEETLTGTVGNATWTLTQNADETTYTLDITGSGTLGKINDIASYKNRITYVRIGGEINGIGWGVFQSYSVLTTVELSENVKTIGSAAFEFDTALKTIFVTGRTRKTGTLDLSYVESIGSWAFDGCKVVQNVIFNTTASYDISVEFLKNNTVIKSLYIPANVGTVKTGAFKGLSSVKTIIFGGNTVVEAGWFELKSGNILNIYAPEGSPAYIYAENTDNVNAFTNSGGFSPDAVETGRYGDINVFWELVPNGEDTFALNVFGEGTEYGRTLVYDDATGNNVDILNTYKSKITYVKIGGNIKTIANSAFNGYNAVETLEISENVSKIDHVTFAYCTNLKTIFITGNEPVTGTFDLSNITSFGGYLFDGCRYVENIIFNTEKSFSLPIEFLKNNNALTSLYIPSNITSISPASFSRCTALANVYVEDATVLIEKEGAAKGAYPFVTSSGAPATLSITAKTGSSAHEYALRHDEVTYVSPAVKNIMSDTGVLDTIEIVTGFAPPNYYRTENKIYILFADAACTTLVREVSSDTYDTIYGKTLLESVGFMVRTADYNGLSSLYRFDTTLLGSLGSYSIAEVGTLGEAFVGARPHLTLGRACATKTVIYSGETLVGGLVRSIDGGMATFAGTATGFEKNGVISEARASKEIMFCAYAIVRNTLTGEEEVIYTDIGVKSLADACAETLALPEAQNLSTSERNFMQSIVDKSVDKNRLPTKEEVKKLIGDAYMGGYILSGQHIGGTENNAIDYYLERIYENSGRYPAVLAFDAGVQYRATGAFGERETMIVNDLTTFAKHGGTVSISAHFSNPDPDYLGSDAVRGSVGSTARWDELFTAGTTINENFMKQLEYTADVLEAFETNGVTVLWRPFHETNGAWFWFCGATMYSTFYGEMKVENPTWTDEMLNAAAYAKAYEYYNRLYNLTYDYMMTERGLTNLIWVISPNIAPDGRNTPTFSVDKFIPASDKYEITGMDWYMGGTLANPAEELFKDAYANVYSTLVGTGKPVVLGEWGPGDGLRGMTKELTYNGEQVLDLMTRLHESGISFGYILFWSSWNGALISLYEMGKTDVFMQSDFVIDLSEVYEMITEDYVASIDDGSGEDPIQPIDDTENDIEVDLNTVDLFG